MDKKNFKFSQLHNEEKWKYKKENILGFNMTILP